MAIGLFNIYSNETAASFYEITSPIVDEVTINLVKKYYEDQKFVIKVYQ